MRSVCLSVIILLGVNSFSQNWNLIDAEKTYFFKHTDSLYITNTIDVDSTEMSGSDTSYFIHTTIKVCDTCTLIPSQAVGGVLYHAYWPEIFGLSPMYSSANNEFISQDGAIKHQAEISDSWIFNSTLSINATVVDKYETTLFGSLDSVKIIELSTLDTILISKNHGVIRYPDFANAGKYFLLVGYHHGQDSFGEYLPNLWRIYDFNTGEVFSFKLEDYSSAFFTIDSRDVNLKILENLSTSTTLAFKVKVYCSRTEINQSWDPWLYDYSATNYIDTFTIEELASCYESTYSGIVPKFPYTDGSLSFYNLPYFPNEVISEEYIFEGNFYALASHKFDLNYGYQKTFLPFYLQADSIGYFSTSFYNSWYVSFTEGLGRDSLNFYGFEAGSLNELRGYIKNDDTTGLVYDFPEDLATSTQSNVGMQIYPNPATNQITVSANLTSISIYSISGQLILHIENPDQLISISDLAKGMYVVRAIDQENNQFQQKLIVE